MLFDLFLDPIERNNLAEDKRYKEIKQELACKLEEWMKETGDPLVDGVRLEDDVVANLQFL